MQLPSLKKLRISKKVSNSGDKIGEKGKGILHRMRIKRRIEIPFFYDSHY